MSDEKIRRQYEALQKFIIEKEMEKISNILKQGYHIEEKEEEEEEWILETHKLVSRVVKGAQHKIYQEKDNQNKILHSSMCECDECREKWNKSKK